jgi:hypothetical protein
LPKFFFQKNPNINYKQRKAVESTYAQKADHKMLKKLTLVVNFTKILQAAFLPSDPKRVKDTDG